MASIKYTAVVSEIKGSIAGTTFQSNRMGGCIRTKPNGPASPAGKITKADAGRNLDAVQATTEVSSSWKSLTSTQQASWTTAAPNYPFKNRFGNTYTPTGFQLFMSINTRFAIFGISQLTDAPAVVTLENAPAFTVAYSSGAGSLDVASFSFAANFTYILYGARSLSKGRQPQKSDFKMLYQFQITDTFPFSLGNFWTDNFGPIPTHGNLWFRLDCMSTLNGQRGTSTFYQLVY